MPRNRETDALNVADYARVPLLNPNQLSAAARTTAATENEYDRRMIPAGKRAPAFIS